MEYQELIRNYQKHYLRLKKAFNSAETERNKIDFIKRDLEFHLTSEFHAFIEKVNLKLPFHKQVTRYFVGINENSEGKGGDYPPEGIIILHEIGSEKIYGDDHGDEFQSPPDYLRVPCEQFLKKCSIKCGIFILPRWNSAD